MKLTKTALVKHCISLGLIGLGLAFGGCGKGEDTQTVSPASSGKRGETCLARNDCASGLACISGICSKNDFPQIETNLKECVAVQCDTTADCCGDKPLEVPSKCENRTSICETPYILSCYNDFEGADCTASAQCGGGTCDTTTPTCSNGLGSCTTAADCSDVCENIDATSGYGTCSYSNTSCTSDASCTYNSYGAGTCGGTCDCTNPAYDYTDPICTDPDCEEDVCGLKCDDNQLCVLDTPPCTEDLDCAGNLVNLLCNDDGKCVQCLKEADCEEGEKCNSEGVCEAPCKADEECPFLWECNADTGECEEAGCKSDLQCVYWFSTFGDSGVADPREAKCVTVEGQDFKQCRIPCETDAECGTSQICKEGTCTYIGCKTEDDCRGMHPEKQTPDDETPYVTHWECQLPKAEK